MSFQVLPILDRELMDSPKLTGFSLTATQEKLQVYRTMRSYADRTEWVVTDMPMYAFLIEKPVPPTLATFSRKRLVTGELTDMDILLAMQTYQPEQVMMARFVIPTLEDYLKENYNLILNEDPYRLFLRKDISP